MASMTVMSMALSSAVIPRFRRLLRGGQQRACGPPGRAQPGEGGEAPVLLVVPFAAVTSGIPALLAWRIGELAVHVLGSTVSPARQKSRSETNHARESPDCQDHCGEEEERLPPRHLDHHDPIWTVTTPLPDRAR
jgi:hypothetical protein